MMKLADRRTVLATIVAAISFPARAGATESVPAYSDEEVSKILVEEAEAVLPSTEATLGSFWFQKPEGRRLSPNWPQDNLSYDYVHIAAYELPAEQFEFTGEMLLDYMRLCSYGAEGKEKLLFGLRGCVLTGQDRAVDFARAHLVRETRPDHVNTLCLLGVFDPKSKTLALFAGSTVPNVDLMEMQARGLLGCNMLPTGLHAYRVGPHKGIRQPGAFRQQASLWVHRAKGKLEYSLNDQNNIWDDLGGALPADNIHAAVLNYRHKPPYFSSAGCQVVEGAYSADAEPIGPWANFRRCAGLTQPPVLTTQAGTTTDDGREFGYVLLTGKEAHLMAAKKPASIETLRFGSEGARVVKLQELLVNAGTLNGSYERGKVDRNTMGALIQWQRSKGFTPTGILARNSAPALDIW
jgi:hypothetical protein